jgi:thiamine biosynthesis lipoprotein
MIFANKTTRRDFLKLCSAAGLLAATPSILVPLAEASSASERFTETRLKMGTFVQFTLAADSKDRADEALAAAWSEIDRLSDVFDRHRPGTVLSELNAAGRLSDPGPEMIDVLGQAADVHHLSDGAFDPSILPLLALLEESFQKNKRPPDDQAVTEALELVDFSAVRFDRREVALKGQGQRITLDGVAKGYIVDRAGAALRAKGVENALINAGGDVLALGFSDTGRPWRVAVQDPFHRDRFLKIIALANQAVATSGSYEVFFDPEHHNHHLIDPRKGRSADILVSASTLAPTAARADALATALFVGPQMAAKVEGMIVNRDGRADATPRFEKLYLEG